MSTRCNKVFGIGLSRTGTMSLSAALTMLGVRTVHFPRDHRTFVQLRTGDYHLDVLREHDGVCDTPVVPYYPQLDRAFPGSRFVLTLRNDLDAWLASVEKLWSEVREMTADPYLRFVNTAVYGTWTFSAERFLYVYERHLRDVRDYFAGRREDLLELRICEGEGWAELARFVDRPEPDIGFPHLDVLNGDHRS